MRILYHKYGEVASEFGGREVVGSFGVTLVAVDVPAIMGGVAYLLKWWTTPVSEQWTTSPEKTLISFDEDYGDRVDYRWIWRNNNGRTPEEWEVIEAAVSYARESERLLSKMQERLYAEHGDDLPFGRRMS